MWVNLGLYAVVIEDRVKVGVVIVTAGDDQRSNSIIAFRLRLPDYVLRRCGEGKERQCKQNQ